MVFRSKMDSWLVLLVLLAPVLVIYAGGKRVLVAPHGTSGCARSFRSDRTSVCC
jgi:RNase P/RNase MRP subunit POP5